ncbi:ethanolamine ammonia-lyase large subunit [Bradyrhizobium diazoefficiens]
MVYRHTIDATTYAFPDLRDLLAKATPPRSGDRLAGIAAASAEQMIAARMALADVPLGQFLQEALIPYETDEVTRLVIDSHDARAFAPVASLTVGAFRDWLLSDAATPEILRKLAPGITPEMAAAVSKLMRNQDLILAARKCEVTTAFRNTIGLKGRMSTRLQPNHPFDDARGITASILDGILLGAGDACIGINPASDDPTVIAQLLRLLDEIIARLKLPTQGCVLTHVTTTLSLIGQGVPVDLVFQSVAGTEAANRSFGVDLDLLREAQEAGRSQRRGTVGQNVMYFETGQGSALCPPMPITASTSRPARRAPMRSHAPMPRCWSTAWSASSARNISTTARKSSGRGWRIIFAASCSACRSGSTSATPTTPRQTRTTWITC